MKNLLKLGDLTEQEITAILNTADQLKIELKIIFQLESYGKRNLKTST